MTSKVRHSGHQRDSARRTAEWQMGGLMPLDKLRLERPLPDGVLYVPRDLEILAGPCEAEASSGPQFHEVTDGPDRFRIATRPLDWRYSGTPLDGITNGVEDRRTLIIQTNGPSIAWRGGSVREVAPGGPLLDQFVQLREAPDEELLKFARRWGTLGLCEHGLPRFHPRHGWCDGLRLRSHTRSGAGVFIEPLAGWRQVADAFRSTLNLGAEINQGRLGSEDDWKRAMPNATFEKPPKTDAARALLMVVVNGWLSSADVRPEFGWGNGEWQIRLKASDGPTGLSGHLALGLALAVAKKDGLVICSSCHGSYMPNRRPNPHRRNYCPKCGCRAAWRDAARARRQRSRETARKIGAL
jgi:hypothetical protein